MKKLFNALMIAIIGSLTFIACSEDNQTEVSKKNSLQLIKKDILEKKFYPNEKNKYDYSSVNFKRFLNQNTSLVNNIDTESNLSARVTDSVTLEEYKDAVINFYSDSEHSSTEINQRFEYTQSLSAQYEYDYTKMLEDFVTNGVIPEEEKDIILEYVNYFFTTESFEEFTQITSVFTHYVNNSDFSEFEKRGMLTIFDTFKSNKDLLEKSYTEFKFLQLLQSNNTDGTTGKRRGGPNAGLKCAGDVLVPMLGGAAVGNGLGFVVGFATGMWTAYSNGCMD